MFAKREFNLPPRLPKGWLILPVEDVPVGAEIYTFDSFIRGRWILGGICPYYLDSSYIFPCLLTEDAADASCLIDNRALVAYNANAPLMPVPDGKK